MTATESGHVARWSFATRRFERIVRVPGAPENTVFASAIGPDLLVGLKWNHRHSELFLVDAREGLRARWPPDGEVRWGMPAPIVVADRVLTYSDEGPHRKCLALISLPDLRELDHVEVPEWPGDAATWVEHDEVHETVSESVDARGVKQVERRCVGSSTALARFRPGHGVERRTLARPVVLHRGLGVARLGPCPRVGAARGPAPSVRRSS